MAEIRIDTEALYNERAKLLYELDYVMRAIDDIKNKSDHGNYPIELSNRKTLLEQKIKDVENKLLAFIQADILLGEVESAAKHVIGDIRTIQEEPDSKHIEIIEKQIKELSETTSRTIQQLKTASLTSGIEPRLSVVQPNVRLVDANLAYKYADVQSDVNTMVGFTTLFLGTALTSGISLILALLATSQDSISISVHATVTIMSFIVSGSFGYLWWQVREKAKIAKKILENDAGEKEVNLRLSTVEFADEEMVKQEHKNP